MTPEHAAQLALIIGGIVAIITAARGILLALSGFIKDGKELWRGLKANNKDTALIKAMTERINQCQISQSRLDFLERWFAAYQTHPACQGECRDAIEQMADDRRIRPHHQSPNPTGHTS